MDTRRNATPAARPAIALLGVLALAIWPAAVDATWSIVAMDCRTGEIAIGSATCLTNFDLRQGVPVVVVGRGAGAAQSFVDVTGANRARIRLGLIQDRPPDQILAQLDFFDDQHQTRQYGIVDHRGRTLTFTGSGAGEFADGVTGWFGTVAYAIQGNVITGAPVLKMAEAALIETPGDLPAKLMAAMEAARSMGGDGRCSCQPSDPTGCGSPPEQFEKSAHIGFVIVARAGDMDGTCNATVGCASGDYFMNFNIAFQTPEDPDPVLQLAELFDQWRATLIGRADALSSETRIDPPALPARQPGTAVLALTLRDWLGDPVDDPELVVTVEHAAGGPGTSTIGKVQALGQGLYRVAIGSSDQAGIERFKVTVLDPKRSVVLMPAPQLIQADAADLNLDGDVDLDDAAGVIACLGGPDSAPSEECLHKDATADGRVDLGDVAALQATFTAPPCKVLYITRHPIVPSFVYCGESMTTDFEVQADPPARVQWLLDGEPILGATSPTYHLESATLEDGGHYSVQVVNSCGLQVSEDDLMIVVPDPETGCE